MPPRVTAYHTDAAYQDLAEGVTIDVRPLSCRLTARGATDEHSATLPAPSDAPVCDR
jgi:hypothetical protein